MSEPARVKPSAAAISAAKRALLERRLRGEGPALKERSGGIPPRPADQPRLASLGQRTMWLLDQASDNRAAYNITSSFRLTGELSLERLEDAIRMIRARHEVLRCVYRPGEHALEQVLVESAWDGIERWEAATEAELQVRATAVARSELDVERGPLWRVHHVACREGPDLLMLVIHDLIADKWSLLQFWKEVGTVYNAQRAGRDPALEPLTRQFADFAAWQQARMESGLAARQRAYWAEQLKDPPAPLPLPGDRPYPEIMTESGRLLWGTVPPEVAQRVRGLAATEDASVFMVSLLAFQLLVERLAAVDDVVIASPVANRRTPETATMLGFLLSTVPLRTNLKDRPSVREALRRTRATVLGALEHQDIPLDQIVEAVRPPRVPGRHTLAQVMFVYQRQTEAEPPLALDGVEIRNTYIETQTSKFDLSFFVAEAAGGGFQTIVEYRTDLFDGATIARWLEAYGRLLGALAEDPARSVDELDFRSAREASLGRPDVDLPTSAHASVLAAIREQVEATPEQTALRGTGEPVLYRELWAWSGAIAEALRAEVPEPARVGLLLEKGPAAIAAMLGILRAGAAYLPLDPAYPESRNRAVLADAAVDCLLVSAHTREAAAALTPSPRLLVADVPSDLREASAERIPSADQLAYLIYTSGSTGTPKGVEVTHGNLWASTRARNAIYGDDPGTFLLLPSLSFDSSVAGLFWTLCGGGTLVVPSTEALRDPAELARWIEREGVTGTLGIPALYRELLAAAPTCLGSLQRVILAGEACPVALVRKHFEVLPEATLHNEYGPTEGTVWATVHQLGGQDLDASSIPIGRPIPGAEIHLLDAPGQPVPIGVVGEIWIGGAGVARGYRGLPDLTRERFPVLPGRGRLYRTGDLGRWRADGALEFIGRVDRQVKINGHRIELGEIEAVLESFPTVAEGVVLLGPNPSARSASEADRLLESAAAKVPADVMEKWIAELAPAAVAGPERSVRKEKFQLDLRVLDPRFVQPPRKRQRDWMLGQAMAEFAADLEHLDAIAPRFVPGHDHDLGEDLIDITQAALTDDQIMEDWMTPIMAAMSKAAAGAHGDVLEIGFGRGVAAEMIQQIGVASHAVVEMNDHSVNHYFAPWRARYPDRAIRLFHARWQDVVEELGTFDGVLFHAFPMNEAEFIEYVMQSVTFAEHAFAAMAGLLRPGGVFTYMTTEVDSLSRRHQRALFQHFRSLELQVAPVAVPPDTRDTWWAESMVLIKAVK